MRRLREYLQKGMEKQQGACYNKVSMKRYGNSMKNGVEEKL